MAELVYILCALTCLVCALLLGRGYMRTRNRLLLWSTLCFTGLFMNNVVTVIDLVVVPDVDLMWLRTSISFVAVAVQVIGLIWEAP
jgi:hypothetical protein